VRIHVKLAKPADHPWLHARKIDINKVELIDASGTSHERSIDRTRSVRRRPKWHSARRCRRKSTRHRLQRAAQRQAAGPYKVTR
jgi:hypothetical protein